jgi:hypothetical protein
VPCDLNVVDQEERAEIRAQFVWVCPAALDVGDPEQGVPFQPDGVVEKTSNASALYAGIVKVRLPRALFRPP